MKHLKRLLPLALAVLMTLTLCACGGDKAEIRSTLKDFQSACRTLDLDEILDCIDPDVAAPFRTGASFLGNLTGQTSEELLDSVVPFLFGDDYASSAFLSSITIQAEDIAVSGSAATAMCTVSYTLNGETVERSATFRFIQAGEANALSWYISSVKFD